MDDLLTVVLVFVGGYATAWLQAALWRWVEWYMDDELGVHDRPPTEQVKAWLVGLWACWAIAMTAAAVLATWGVLLMLPLDTFGGPAYAAFRAVGLSETLWGVLFLLVALALSGGVALRRRRWRMVGLMGAAGLFAFVATMLLLGNPAGFGWAGNAGYVGLCLFALRRLDW